MSKKNPEDYRVQLTFTKSGDGDLYQSIESLFTQIGKRERARRLKEKLVRGFLCPPRNAAIEVDVHPEAQRSVVPVTDSISGDGRNGSQSSTQAQLVGMKVTFGDFGS